MHACAIRVSGVVYLVYDCVALAACLTVACALCQAMLKCTATRFGTCFCNQVGRVWFRNLSSSLFAAAGARSPWESQLVTGDSRAACKLVTLLRHTMNMCVCVSAVVKPVTICKAMSCNMSCCWPFNTHLQAYLARCVAIRATSPCWRLILKFKHTT